MNYRNDLYCRHPFHVKDGKPQKIDRKTFFEKKCGNQKKGPCNWLVSYQIFPSKVITKTGEHKKGVSDHQQLIERVDMLSKDMRVLSEEYTCLRDKYKDLLFRYNMIVAKITNPKKEKEE